MLDIEPGFYDQRVDLEDDNLQTVRYGRWSSSKEGRYLVPSHLSGSDYSGSIAERSNYQVWQDTFPRGEDKWWTTAPGGHGTFAIVIDLEKVPKKREVEVTDFLNALENYPVADENVMSEMESEAQDEAWQNWARKEFKDGLELQFDLEFDEVDEGKLRQLFEDAAQRAHEYWENQQGGDVYIQVEKVLQKGKITGKDIDALEATYLALSNDDDGPGFFLVEGRRPRRTEEDYYESFEDAEEAAFALLREYQTAGSARAAEGGDVEVVEAGSRKAAREGKGHVWWSNGLRRGPSVDPRQALLPFRG